MSIALGIWCGLTIMTGAQAAKVTTLDVTRDEAAYIVDATLVVDASRPAAFRAATSFEALAERARLIESSRRMGADRLSSRLSMCVLFYCKTVHQVMDLQLDPPQRIDMQVVRGQGDFKAGEARWQFDMARPDTTRVRFHARMVPDFWVPPMIGTWAMTRALRDQVTDTGRAIESLAESPSSPQGVTSDPSTDTSP